MRITKRDNAILDFLDEFGCATSSQIQRIFNMSAKTQCRRMDILVKNGLVKRKKYNPVNNIYSNRESLLKNENLYYMKKFTSKIQHDLLVNEFYIKLNNLSRGIGFSVDEFVPSYKISIPDHKVISDAMFKVTLADGTKKEFLLEVENNKSFSYKKYYKLEVNEVYIPTVIVVTDRKVVNYCRSFELIKMKLNLSNVSKLINELTVFEDNTYTSDCPF